MSLFYSLFLSRTPHSLSRRLASHQGLTSFCIFFRSLLSSLISNSSPLSLIFGTFPRSLAFLPYSSACLTFTCHHTRKERGEEGGEGEGRDMPCLPALPVMTLHLPPHALPILPLPPPFTTFAFHSFHYYCCSLTSHCYCSFLPHPFGITFNYFTLPSG